MSRSTPANLKTQFDGTEMILVFFFKTVWDSGITRLWTGYEDITWDSQTWSGIGHLGGFSAISESREVRANGMSFTLTGVPSSLVSLMLADGRQGNEVSLWIGALDSSGSIVTDPYKLFSGLMDVPGIQEGGDTSTITLTAENRLIELTRANEVRHTDQFQRSRFSGDKGLEYIATLQNKSINWGKN
jgi:hypothetical protein